MKKLLDSTTFSLLLIGSILLGLWYHSAVWNFACASMWWGWSHTLGYFTPFQFIGGFILYLLWLIFWTVVAGFLGFFAAACASVSGGTVTVPTYHYASGNRYQGVSYSMISTGQPDNTDMQYFDLFVALVTFICLIVVPIYRHGLWGHLVNWARVAGYQG